MLSLSCRQGFHEDCQAEFFTHRIDEPISQVVCECACHKGRGWDAGDREPRNPSPSAPVRSVEIEYPEPARKG